MEKNVPTIYDIPLTPATITRHIYLTESFETPSEYIQTCQALLELEEYDRAEIHINSGGGSVAVSNMVCNAMSKSKARVCTVLESDCHSAASVIFLLGDEFEVTPDASMILHVGFFGAFGEKASDTVKDASFTESVHWGMIRRAYEGFLTPEEIEELLEGKNFRLNSEDIIKRLEGLVQYRQDKMQEMVEELQDTAEPEEVEDVKVSDEESVYLESTDWKNVAWVDYEEVPPLSGLNYLPLTKDEGSSLIALLEGMEELDDLEYNVLVKLKGE